MSNKQIPDTGVKPVSTDAENGTGVTDLAIRLDEINKEIKKLNKKINGEVKARRKDTRDIRLINTLLEPVRGILEWINRLNNK